MAEAQRLFDIAAIGSGVGGSTLGAILARHGHSIVSAWQIDISWWGIRFLELVGLVREVRR